MSAAHLPGLAPPGTPIGVLVPLNVTGGISGNFSGIVTLGQDDLNGLLAGLTYLNVHTATNGPGEIRGQVVPEPSTGVYLAMGVLSLLG